MKTTLLSCLLFFFVSGTPAQDDLSGDDILFGEPMNWKNGIQFYEGILGFDSENYYALRYESVPYIERYNNELTLDSLGEIVYDIGHGFFESNLEGIVHFGDSIYLFYSIFRMNTTTLYVRSINRFTLELYYRSRKLMSFQNVKLHRPEYYIELSLERSKLLIAAHMSVPTARSIFLKMKVFDVGLKQIWEADDIIRNKQRTPDQTDFVVDEEANVHVLHRITESFPINFRKGNIKNEYLILSYSETGVRHSENKFSIDDYYIRRIQIIPGPTGTFYCGGFYSHTYKKGILGAFLVRNNPLTGMVEIPRLHSLQKESTRDRNNPDFYEFQVRDMAVRSNGTVTMVGQQERSQEWDNLNDLYVMNFSPLGDLNWSTLIRKKQSGDYGSYAFIAPADITDVCLLFNDNIKNPLYPKPETKLKSFKYGKSYLKAIYLDASGNLRSEKKMTRKQRELVPVVNRGFDMRDGSYVIYMKHPYRARIRYMKIDLL